MGRKIPENSQGMGELLPSSVCIVEGQSFDPKPTGNGKHNFNCRATVIEPAELAGGTLFDSFVIGSDNDPEALKDETWLESFGNKRMISCFEAGGYDIRGQDEEVLQATYINMRYKVSVLLSTEPEVVQFGPNKGQSNPYAGNERNNVKRYWRVDEGPEPMVMPKAGVVTALKGTPMAAAPKAAPPAPTAAPKAAPAAAPKATPAAAAPKAAPKGGNAQAGPAKVAGTPGSIKCVVPDCGEMVALAEFPKHVAEKHPDA